MYYFGFSWELRNEERSYNKETRCGFWMSELNAEWKVKCICQRYKLRNIAFIEIHRKSPDGERLISGTLEISERHKIRFKKNFICLLEDGCLFARIDFKYCRDVAKPPAEILKLRGRIDISRRIEDSFDVTDLAHVTMSDYSSLKQLSTDMEKMLLEKSHFADVTIKCGTVSIPTHKSILSARCPKFKAMFSSPMKEALQNEIAINDMEAPALQATIKYIYTGKLDESLFTNLEIISNKYQIVGIEFACHRYLLRNIAIWRNQDKCLYVFRDLVSPHLVNLNIRINSVHLSSLKKGKTWVELKPEYFHVLLLSVDIREDVTF